MSPERRIEQKNTAQSRPTRFLPLLQRTLQVLYCEFMLTKNIEKYSKIEYSIGS